jgi:hypothetical protein
LTDAANGWDWGLSRQSASKIGTVESRRYVVSQPFETVEKRLLATAMEA